VPSATQPSQWTAMPIRPVDHSILPLGH